MCVCEGTCTCGAGGLSIWGLRMSRASSRGVCVFLNFPSNLLNTSTQCQRRTFAGFFKHICSVQCASATLCVNTIILMLCAPREQQLLSQHLLAVCCRLALECAQLGLKKVSAAVRIYKLKSRWSVCVSVCVCAGELTPCQAVAAPVVETGSCIF